MTSAKVGNVEITYLPKFFAHDSDENDREMVLSRPYKFELLYKGTLKKLFIPKGFNWDGASIPRFAWALVGSPWTGPQKRAALPHDAGYCGTEGLVLDQETNEHFNMPRKDWDDLFLSCLIFRGASFMNRNTMHRAVRDWGWVRFQDGKG